MKRSSRSFGLCLAALGGCTSPAGGTTAAAPVVGTWVQRYHQHTGDIDVPVGGNVTAWLPDQSPSGFQILPADRTGAGEFAIAGIPEGETYLLQVDDGSPARFYVTDQRVLDLLEETAIRHMPPPVRVTRPTPLKLAVTGMAPYATSFAVGDLLEVDAFEIAYQSLDLRDRLQASDTAITLDHDWGNANTSILGVALPDGEAGDEVELVHYRTERRFTPTDQLISTTHLADLLSTRLTLADGGSATLAAAFPALANDHAVSISFDPSLEIVTASANTRRAYRSIRISAHPLWAEATLQLTLFELLVEPRDGAGIVRPPEDITYADPVPASWKRTLTITDEQYRGYRYPGPISDVDQYRLLSQTTTVSTEYTGVVDTSTALPRPSGVLLGGQDFVAGGKLPVDGPTIPLTWDPVPAATAYHLQIWRITPQYTMLAASFYTDGASLQLPASLFQPGDVLALELGAEQFPRATAGALVPHGLPRRTTELVSGRFRLVPQCGDGVTQSDEECDDGRETAACNADCTLAQCGDGIRNAAFGEDCDDAIATTGCTASCARAP